jgi:hypothetical protein
MIRAVLNDLKGGKRLESVGQFSNYISIFLARSNLGGEAGCYGPSREGWDRSVGRPEAQNRLLKESRD